MLNDSSRGKDMKYKELIAKLEKGEYAPVYLLAGEEAYYIDQVAEYIEQHALDEMAREFDQTIVYGRDLAGGDLGPVIAAARGFAMMGGRKVVILKEAQVIKKWEPLALYLDNPQPTTILVICYKYGKLDKRLAVWKNLEKKGGVLMESDRLKDYQVGEWISQYLNQRLSRVQPPCTVDPRVPSMLAEYIGADLTAIVGAIDKLLDGRPEDCHRIDMALVERNIGISKDYNVFELQDAIIRGDVVRANRITQYFASSKDHPMVKELGMLYTFFQNLLLYHYLPDKSDRVAGPMLGVNPFFVKDYAAAARRYSAAKAFRIIGYFRDTDARLKGINNPSAKDEDLWKELVYKIMH